MNAFRVTLPFALLVMGCLEESSSSLAGTLKDGTEDARDELKSEKQPGGVPAGRPAPDGDSEPSSVANGIFTGAPAFKASPPARTANDMHILSVTGQACFECHTEDPDDKPLLYKILGKNPPKLLFGGTVFRGTQPAAGVEVRLVDKDGLEQGSTHSDADGNFWVKRTSASAAGRVAARDATGEHPMVAPISNGDCNSSQCHGEKNRITVR